MLTITPRAKYRKVLLELAHQPSSHGWPEAPYLVAGVTFADVASAMSVPRPALYRLWETQYDFWVDLSRYIAYEIDYSQVESELPWNKLHGQSPQRPVPDVAEADMQMLGYINAVQSIVMNDLRVLIRAASLGYPDISNLGQIRRQVETERLESLGEEITTSWASVSGPMIELANEPKISATIWCIADEISVINRFIPDVCAKHAVVDFGGGENSCTLLALIVRAMCHGFSTPSSGAVDQPTDRERHAIPPPDNPWTEAQFAALDTARSLFLDSIADSRTDIERPVVLGYVTVGRVASNASVSRRTIYNVWPTRDEMMSDLLEDLLTQQANDFSLRSIRTGPMWTSAPSPPLSSAPPAWSLLAIPCWHS